MGATGFDEEFDVVVVGSALRAPPPRSMRIRPAPRFWSSRSATRRQRAATPASRAVAGGVNRDPERARIFLHALNGPFPVAEEVVEAWAASETAEISPWLKGLGADVAMSGDYHTEPEYLELEGSDCYAGMDTVGGGWATAAPRLPAPRALAERGIETRFRTPAVELIVDAGAVVGVVVAGPPDTDGSARVAASCWPRGIRGRSADGAGLPAGRGPRAVGIAGLDRRRHRLAQAVGADLWHMDNMMTITGVRGDDEFRALPGVVERAQLPVGVRRRAPFHRRELRAQARHTARGGAYELFPLRPFHLIFDEQMRTAGPLSPTPDVLPVGWNLLMNGSRWSVDNSAEIEKGWIRRADSIAELADLIGVDAQTLERTVEQYNAACEAGRDDPSGASRRRWAP